MSARDFYHKVVVDALENDGWTITDDPLTLNIDDVTVKIDLGAEELLGAEQNGRKIAVEIKSFRNASPLSDFHVALGQYLNYQYALEVREPERKLYLAVPVDAYERFFVGRFARQMIHRHNLKIIVFSTAIKEVVQWEE